MLFWFWVPIIATYTEKSICFFSGSTPEVGIEGTFRRKYSCLGIHGVIGLLSRCRNTRDHGDQMNPKFGVIYPILLQFRV